MPMNEVTVERQGGDAVKDFSQEYVRLFGNDPSGEWSAGQGFTRPFKKLSIFQPMNLTYSSQAQVR